MIMPLVGQGYNSDEVVANLNYIKVDPNAWFMSEMAPQITQEDGTWLQHVIDDPSKYIMTAGPLKSSYLTAHTLGNIGRTDDAYASIYWQITDKTKWWVEIGGIQGKLTGLRIQFQGNRLSSSPDYAASNLSLVIDGDTKREPVAMKLDEITHGEYETFHFTDPSVKNVLIQSKVRIYFLDVHNFDIFPSPLIEKIFFDFE